ncbi:hypothetical protein CSIM01_07491 [Colletotrichum simmondsii]|uniref:Rhodopsin domain-containing protein n=1 Tax=Colletotrichum simmondsii TaxID=703756 RepID=A0A135SNS5_9PEZI|nr:hypothetical protein CSIM01_07491 [Colletotrichum simmondsii]
MAMPLSTRAECWVWYGLAIGAVVMRYQSQYLVRKRRFFDKMTIDDILMAIIVLIYTTSISALYIYFDIVATTDFDALAPDEYAAVGRKMGILNILSETSMQTTLWGNKCCLLLLYNRLTLFGHYRKTWVSVAAYTGLAYVAVIVSLYGGWCRPFSEYMELQPENAECLTWKNYNILQITMNLSTDLVLLLIPVTLISRLKMKIGKKLLLICLFSMGVFVMLCAILTKVAVFTYSTDFVWFMWCVRETSTAMLVGNLVLGMPTLRAAWRCVFPQSTSTPLRDGESSAGTGETYATYNTAKKVSRVGSDAWSAAEQQHHHDGGGPSQWNAPPATRVAISSVYTDFELYGKAGAKGESRRLSMGSEHV